MGMTAEFSYNVEGLTFFDLAIENRHKDVASHIIGHGRWSLHIITWLDQNNIILTMAEKPIIVEM